MNKITILAMLLAAFAAFSQKEAMNLKIKVTTQFTTGGGALEGDSLYIVPENSTFPTIGAAANIFGNFTIEDYIAETPIHDTGNTPVSNLNVINYDGALGIQEGTKIVNQRMYTADGKTVPADAFVLQYVMDAKTQKFANGIFTGEMSDYRTEVPSFTSQNNSNILKIK